MIRASSAPVLLLAVIASIGCANRSGDDGEPQTLEQRTAYGSGYYEVEHEGTRYVVGSAEAAENVKGGKLPRQTVSRFSSGGKRVLIDADDSATRARLEHEYDRRHGTAIRF